MTTMRMYKIDQEALNTLESLTVTSMEIQDQEFTVGDNDKATQSKKVMKNKDALIQAILTNPEVSIPSVGKISFVSIAPDVLANNYRMLFVMTSLADYVKNQSLGNPALAHSFFVVQNLSFITDAINEEMASKVVKESKESDSHAANQTVKIKKNKDGYAVMSMEDTDTPNPDETPGDPDDKKTSSRSTRFKCNFFNCFDAANDSDEEMNNLVLPTQPTSQTMGTSNGKK